MSASDEIIPRLEADSGSSTTRGLKNADPGFVEECTNLVGTLSSVSAEVAKHRVCIQNVFFHRLFSRFCSACLSLARSSSSGKPARLPCSA